MIESHTKDRIFADIVTTFHFLWTFLIFCGSITMFFIHWYAPYEITILTITVIANFPFRRSCPLTVLEERLRRKIDPSYANHNSFMTTYLNKIFGTNFKIKVVNTVMVIFYVFSYSYAIWFMIRK